MTRYLAAAFCAGVLVAQVTWAQNSDENATAQQQIRAAGEAYIAAFNAHDADAMAELWTADAVYTNRDTGETVRGRNAIAAQFVEIFKNQENLKIDVQVESVQLISPNAAVEHGVAKLLAADSDPEDIQYTAVYIRSNDRWLLDRVADRTPEVVPSHYDQLRQLEWIIGDWVDQDETFSITTECRWTRNRNFITRAFTVSDNDDLVMAGMQIIGWDAAQRQIRSWTFDSDGGWSQATWTKDGDRWHIRKNGVLADGRKTSAVNTIRYIDKNSHTFESTLRTLDGNLLPNVAEVLVVRKR